MSWGRECRENLYRRVHPGPAPAHDAGRFIDHLRGRCNCRRPRYGLHKWFPERLCCRVRSDPIRRRLVGLFHLLEWFGIDARDRIVNGKCAGCRCYGQRIRWWARHVHRSRGLPGNGGRMAATCLVAQNSGECDSGFVTKLNASGALVWSTFYGSPSTASGNQTVSAIALDSLENVYITANASGLGDYPLNNGFQGFAGGAAYITELSSDASKVLFGSYYGGQANVNPVGLVVDTKENIYLAGYTAGADLPLVNAYQTTDGGGC